MHRSVKVFATALGLGIVAALVVPYLLPKRSTGTLSYMQAAGPAASFLSLAGIAVHIEHRNYRGQESDPPLIILMHGFGASTFSWREVLDPLTQFGEVVAYDRPGFGFTERPESSIEVDPYGWRGNFRILDSLIAHYGTERNIVLVGHSAGGELAAQYCLMRPESIAALILVDPAILTTGGPPPWAEWILRTPPANQIGPILVGGIAKSGDVLLRKSYFNPAKVNQEIYDGYHAPMKIEGWERAFWDFTKAPRIRNLPGTLDSISQPTLIISGDADTVVPVSDALELEKLIPNSWLELISECGHLPHEERPAEFMEAIASHWNELTQKFEPPGHLIIE